MMEKGQHCTVSNLKSVSQNLVSLSGPSSIYRPRYDLISLLHYSTIITCKLNTAVRAISAFKELISICDAVRNKAYYAKWQDRCDGVNYIVK